jgi:8-oxo-dGTP diphosphatase
VKLATLCYVRRGGKTLMIHRIKKANDIHEGKWNGLGGKLEAGETPEECAAREVLEEAGLTVHAPQLKGFLTFPNFANNEDWYAFVFVITQFEGELIDSSEGELAWIPDDQIESLNLWAGDRVFLPWLDQPGFFSGKFVYQDGKFIEHQVIFHSG